jgi:hypothetical protein
MIDPNNAVHFPLEFSKSQVSSGITPYELKFKNIVSIMLTSNLNSSREPCSEMRIIIIIIIIITRLLDSCDRDANILSDRSSSSSVYIPRDTSPQVSQSYHSD